jgi:hypothetical protein
MEKESSTPGDVCIICYGLKKKGILCSNNHWICKGCFQKFTVSQLVKDTEIFANNNGKIVCAQIGCNHKFLDSDVLSVCNPKIKEAYLRKSALIHKFMKDIRSTNEKTSREAQLKKNCIGAKQCDRCGLGPVQKKDCDDLLAHSHNSFNGCARCGTNHARFDQMKDWDGNLPEGRFTVKKLPSRCAWVATNVFLSIYWDMTRTANRAARPEQEGKCKFKGYVLVSPNILRIAQCNGVGEVFYGILPTNRISHRIIPVYEKPELGSTVVHIMSEGHRFRLGKDHVSNSKKPTSILVGPFSDDTCIHPVVAKCINTNDYSWCASECVTARCKCWTMQIRPFQKKKCNIHLEGVRPTRSFTENEVNAMMVKNTTVRWTRGKGQWYHDGTACGTHRKILPKVILTNIGIAIHLKKQTTWKIWLCTRKDRYWKGVPATRRKGFTIKVPSDWNGFAKVCFEKFKMDILDAHIVSRKKYIKACINQDTFEHQRNNVEDADEVVCYMKPSESEKREKAKEWIKREKKKRELMQARMKKLQDEREKNIREKREEIRVQLAMRKQLKEVKKRKFHCVREQVEQQKRRRVETKDLPEILSLDNWPMM